MVPTLCLTRLQMFVHNISVIAHKALREVQLRKLS